MRLGYGQIPLPFIPSVDRWEIGFSGRWSFRRSVIFWIGSENDDGKCQMMRMTNDQ